MDGIADGRKRNRLEDISDEPAKKFKCEPCNRYFTEQRSLLRHRRENKKHRPPMLNLGNTISCFLCQKAFARTHDLERHRNEQHLDGKITCLGCGKSIRPQAPHKVSSGAQCNKNSSVGTLGNHPTSQVESDLSHPRGIQDDICNTVLESLTYQLSKTSVSRTSMDMAAYKRQVRTRTAARLLPCGICRAEFEINDISALASHLKEHFKSFDGKHDCKICEIRFVHEADLKRHESSARAGDCGFNFAHKAPCPGHHRPGRNGVPHEALESDDDRFNFAYRLRTWESSQLTTFLSSLQPLVEAKTNGVKDSETIIWTEIIEREILSERDRHSCDVKSATSRLERWGAQSMPSHLLRTGPQSVHNSQAQHDNNNATAEVVSHPQSQHVSDLEDLELEEFLQTMLFQAAEGNLSLWPETAYKPNEGNLDLAALALACGADVDGCNIEGQTALHLAATGGAVGVARLLIEAGADIAKRDGRGESPLAAAAKHDSMGVMKLLTLHGATDRRVSAAPVFKLLSSQHDLLKSTISSRTLDLLCDKLFSHALPDTISDDDLPQNHITWMDYSQVASHWTGGPDLSPESFQSDLVRWKLIHMMALSSTHI